MKKSYSTKEIADFVNVHPNTVRLYEKWGYIAKTKRGKNNYRIFTEQHLYQMKLARVALPGPYPSDGELVHRLVKKFAAGQIENAIKLAKEYLKGVEFEKEKALEAMTVLDRCFDKTTGSKEKILFKTRKKAANHLNVSIDALRTWERNGLFTIKRDNKRKLLFSEWDIEKIMLIRLLRNCGFSIASLLNVFNNEDNLKEQPSKLLSLAIDDSPFYSVTDRYLDYLAEHKKRAEKIIKLIQNY